MQIYRIFRRFNFIAMLPIQAIKIFMIMALLLLLNSNSLDGKFNFCDIILISYFQKGSFSKSVRLPNWPLFIRFCFI